MLIRNINFFSRVVTDRLGTHVTYDPGYIVVGAFGDELPDTQGAMLQDMIEKCWAADGYRSIKDLYEDVSARSPQSLRSRYWEWCVGQFYDGWNSDWEWGWDARYLQCCTFVRVGVVEALRYNSDTMTWCFSIWFTFYCPFHLVIPNLYTSATDSQEPSISFPQLLYST